MERRKLKSLCYLVSHPFLLDGRLKTQVCGIRHGTIETSIFIMRWRCMCFTGWNMLPRGWSWCNDQGALREMISIPVPLPFGRTSFLVCRPDRVITVEDQCAILAVSLLSGYRPPSLVKFILEFLWWGMFASCVLGAMSVLLGTCGGNAHHRFAFDQSDRLWNRILYSQRNSARVVFLRKDRSYSRHHHSLLRVVELTYLSSVLLLSYGSMVTGYCGIFALHDKRKKMLWSFVGRFASDLVCILICAFRR